MKAKQSSWHTEVHTVLTHSPVLPQYFNEVKSIKTKQENQLVFTLPIITGGLQKVTSRLKTWLVMSHGQDVYYFSLTFRISNTSSAFFWDTMASS